MISCTFCPNRNIFNCLAFRQGKIHVFNKLNCSYTWHTFLDRWSFYYIFYCYLSFVIFVGKVIDRPTSLHNTWSWSETCIQAKGHCQKTQCKVPAYLHHLLFLELLLVRILNTLTLDIAHERSKKNIQISFCKIQLY